MNKNKVIGFNVYEEIIIPSNINMNVVKKFDTKSEMDLCPHDGARCWHNCEEECFRERNRMSLSLVDAGYPIDSKLYFSEKLLKKIINL